MIVVYVALLALFGVVYGIRHMSSGFPARSVYCPHRNRRAIISTACATKGRWGTTIEGNILQYSLMPGQPVNWEKSCLDQL